MPYDEESATPKDIEQAPQALKLKSGAGRQVEATVTDPLLPRADVRRYGHLDATRILCVACVALDHGAPKFGQWNAIFVQNWVLQLLFVVSGVAFALSRQSLCGYISRLSYYFCIGVCINVTAWALASKDYRHNIFDVVFQFWFVAGIIYYSLILYPLKSYLVQAHINSIRHWGADDEDLIFELSITRSTAAEAAVSNADDSNDEPAAEPAAEPASEPEAQTEVSEVQPNVNPYEPFWRAMAILCVALTCITLCFTMVLEPLCQAYLTPAIGKLFAWLMPSMGSAMRFWDLAGNPEKAQAMMFHICYYVQSSCCSVCIVILFPMLHKRTSLVGWLVFAHMYFNRILFYRAKDERPFHGFDLFFLAFVVAHLGLRHRTQVAKVVVRYWFVLFMVCALVWIPGTHVRLDTQPPSDAMGRLRVNYLEGFFVIAWLAAGENIFDSKIFTEDRLGFMNTWALAVFLVHKAVHILFPSPTNWAVLLALIPACWLWTWRQTRR